MRADTILPETCNSNQIFYSVLVKHNENLWPILGKLVHESCKTFGALGIICTAAPHNVSELLDSGKANNTALTYKGWSVNAQGFQHLQSCPVNIKDDTGHMIYSLI